MELFNMFATLGLKSDEFNQGLEAAHQKASGFGSAVGTLGKMAVGAFAAAGTAVVAFGKKSIDVGKMFDASMSQLAATMGVPVEQIGDLEAKAMELGRTTQFTASQAAQGMNVLAMAGYDATKIIGTMPEVLNLAAAGGLEIAQAADYMTGIMAGFGLETDRSTDVVNYLAKMASSAKGDVSSFGEGLSTVAGMAKTTGQSVEDMSVALGILGNNNYSAAEGGNALSRALRNLYQPSDTAKKALANLGVSAYTADGQAKPLRQVLLELNGALDGMNDQAKNAVLSKIFDAATLKSIPALMSGATDEWDKLAGAIEQADGAAGEMRDKMQGNLQGDITQFGSALEGVQITFSKQLTPSMREFVQYGTSALSTLTDAFNEGGLTGMFDQMSDVITEGLSLVFGKIPMFVEVTSNVMSALVEGIFNNLPLLVEGGFQIVEMLAKSILGALPNVVETVSTMLHAISNAIWSGIPEIVDGAIGMITGNLHRLRNVLPEMLNAGSNIITSIINGIRQAAPQIAAFLPQIVDDIGSIIIESADTLLETGIEIINALAEGFREGLPVFLENVLPMITEFTAHFRENFGELFSAGIDMLLSLVDGIIASLPTLWEYVPQIVSNIAGLINDNAPKLLGAGIELIARLITGIVNSIPLILQNFGTIVQMAVDVFLAFNWINLGKQLIDFIVSGVKALVSALPDVISNIGQSAWDALSGIDWMGLGGKLIELICYGVNTLFTSIGDALVEIGNDAWEKMKEIDWLDLGSKIIDGVVDGLSNAGGAIKDKLIGLGKDAWEGVKNFFGIKSPSRLMRDTVGKMIPLGLAAGIDAEADAVTDAMDRLGDMAMDSVDIGEVNGDFGANRGGYNQVVNIYSPTALTPSETARQTRNATRDMVLALNGV